MTEVYGDSGYWIAMLNPRDQWHQKAMQITEHIGDRHIVTSELVIAEFLNGMARLGRESRRRGVDTAISLYISQDMTVVRLQDSPLMTAIQRYADRLDQRWSLVDCHSFLIMEERGITDALAYDRDFEQAVFRPHLRES